MDKYKTLAFLNLLVALALIPPLIWFTYALAIDLSNSGPFQKQLTTIFIFAFLPLLGLLFSLFFSYHLAFRRKFFVQAVISASVFYSIWYFFFASIMAAQSYTPLIALLFITILLLATLRDHKKLGICTALVLLTVSIYSIAVGFEEGYCWKRGDEIQAQAEKQGQPTIVDPPEWYKPEDSGLDPNSKVGLAWIAYLECYKNFNLQSALRETYHF